VQSLRSTRLGCVLGRATDYARLGGVIVLPIAAALLVGCANGQRPTSEYDQTRGVERVVRQFMQAAAKRDGAEACALLTDGGRRDMAAYPYQDGMRNTGRSCEGTVNRLDALPRADEWLPLSQGVMVTSVGAGLDSSGVRVSYEAHGRTLQASGAGVQPELGNSSYVVDSPPTPPRIAPSPPRSTGTRAAATPPPVGPPH
jgi:hypothetical protein